jgi:hypothetical protein
MQFSWQGFAVFVIALGFAAAAYALGWGPEAATFGLGLASGVATKLGAVGRKAEE